MKTEEYISSGVLELYVLDQLSTQERKEVEKRIAENDEIREEVDQIERSIEVLAFNTAIEIPGDLKNSIKVQSIQKDALPKDKEVIPLYLKYAVAASVLIAITASILAFDYWNKWQTTKSRLAELIAQNYQYAETLNTVNQELLDAQSSVAIMNSTEFDRIPMNGTDNSPSSAAIVYWNQTSREVYLSIQNLENLSRDQQYQLWAIIDGKPVDAGVFDSNNTGLLLEMKNVSKKPAAFAVTIEPRGGSENPTLETMQVIGNV